MKIFKRLIVVLIIFLILVVLVSMFLPSNLHVERTERIDADKSQLFDQVNDLANWQYWSPWAIKDPTIYADKGNFSEPSSGVDAWFKWDSEHEEVGQGEIKIVASQVDYKVEYDLNLGMGDVGSSFLLEDSEDGVQVTWSVDIEFGFNPIAKFFGLFIEEAISKDYETGLRQLKRYAEDLPKINTVKTEQQSIERSWYLSIRDSIDPKQMNNVHGKMYAEINAYMSDTEIEISGSPIVIYHYWSDTLVDIEAGIPIADSVGVTHNKIKLNLIRAGKVVTAIHNGPYERLPETYFGINEWMRKNKVVVTGPPWEEYITDPATESNPEKWKTAIYFPIE